MTFKKGQHTEKKGYTSIVRKALMESGLQLITIKDIKAFLAQSFPNINDRAARNTTVHLLRAGDIKATGEKQRRFTIYEVIGSMPKKDPAVTAADKTLPVSKSKEVAELEEQLLAEMQKTEDLERRLKKAVSGFDVDELRLGKSVFRAYQDLQTSHNQLDCTLREEQDKFKRLRSEDRQMIGSLQKKVRELEAENSALRSRLHEGISSNKKIDVSVFNTPRLTKGNQ